MPEIGAVAIPGFQPMKDESGVAYTPVSDGGLVAQTHDGETYVQVRAGRIKLKADQIVLEYDGGSVERP